MVGSPGTATILFTDVVGSTQLRVALGEDAADQLWHAHDRALSSVVAEHGGTVVKGTGDGILATFPGAARAVTAAVAMQQVTTSIGANTPRAEVRIGISAGDVTWDGDDCFGTPVVEAARLCDAAEAGQILVADVVRILARGRHGQTLTALGSLDLKGLPEPVVAHEVEWEALGADEDTRVPLPPPLRADREFPFAGRNVELARLRDTWACALRGERRCVVIAGEPGIGKTRLAAQIAATVHEAGGVVLYGRCDEDVGSPYQPFTDALASFVRNTPAPELLAQLGPYSGDLTRLCPDLPDQVPGLPPPLESEPEAERHRLFEAVAGWLRAMSATRPSLIVVDDAHAAAAPTASMLLHLVRETTDSRLLFAVTYRDTEVGRTLPWGATLADLRRIEGVDRLSLEGLSEHDLAHLLDEARVTALTKAVHAETEGNPFFAREVLRNLQESGAISKDAGEWVARGSVSDVGIPEGVREVVGRRLSRLSAAANTGLTTAAVVGMDFDLSVVAIVQASDEDVLIDAFDESVTARLLVEVGVGSYRFSHSLVRSTLYDELSLTARVRLHRRVGEAIEAVAPGDVGALAHHFSIAASGGQDVERGVRYGVAAARDALAALAVGDAKSLATSALELLEGHGDDVLRCDALICLGKAERLLGEGQHREHLIEASRLAQQVGDVDRLVTAVLENGGTVGDVAGVDVERLELIGAALDAVGSSDSTTRARLLALRALELGAFGGAASPEAFTIADDALATARRVDDPATLSFVLHAYADATQVPHTLLRRRELATENIAIAERLADPVALAWAVADLSLANAQSGRFDTLLRDIEHVKRIGDDFGIMSLIRVAYLVRASDALMRGRLDEADTLADEAFRIMTMSGHRSAVAFYGGQLIAIRREQARLGELADLVDRMSADQASVAFEIARALIHVELGRFEPAHDALRALGADGFRAIQYDFLWMMNMCMCAEICASVDDEELASPLFDALSPFADHYAMFVTAYGSVSGFLGRLASALHRFDAAEEAFARAAEIETRAGAVVNLARLRLGWAAMLHERSGPGDVEQAEALVHEALTVATELGLPAIELKARGLSQHLR